MGILRKARQLASRLKLFRPEDDSRDRTSRIRICRVEELEKRAMMAVAPLQFGSVYYEDASGDDAGPDQIIVTFNGGAAGTELKHIVIDGDKLQDGGVTLGDIFFDTAPGGLGSFASHPLQIVSHDGFTITGMHVDDGSNLITFDFDGFVAGDKLVFNIDVDEQGLFSSTAIAEGGEFEGSILTGLFTNSHYDDATGRAIFFDYYDQNFATAATQSGTPLNLPSDNYEPPATVDRSDDTTGAVVLVTQTPKPISLSGVVFHDRNQSISQDAGEEGIGNVGLTLLSWDGTQYVSTGKTTTTDANGAYKFEGLLPGQYRVVETQPTGWFSTGSKPGTVNGVTDGTSTNADILSNITLDGGEDSVRNDFGEILHGSISGRVFGDPEADCQIGPNDVMLKNVTMQLLDSQGNIIATTTTDANGAYKFEDLLPGTYTVHEVQPPGFLQGMNMPGSLGGTLANPDDDSIHAIAVASGQNGTDYNFCEFYPASIAGHVWIDPEGDGVLGPNDTLANGVTVELIDKDGNVIGTQQTVNGAYEFDSLVPGIYSVREVQPATINGTKVYEGGQKAGSLGGTATVDLLSNVTITYNQHGVNYDFYEVLPGSISGRVWAETDGDCTFNAGDVVLSGVKIELLDKNGSVIATTLTDVDGKYEFLDLQPGDYAVRETQPAGYLQGMDMPGSLGGVHLIDNQISTIDVGPNQHGVNYDFCEALPANLSGRVWADPEGDCVFGPNDTPLANVEIELLNSSGLVIATTLTDNNGQYSFDNLHSGTYSVRETQPAGYFEGGEMAGSTGGVTSLDLISQIPLNAGQNSVENDFCEALPASLSGHVWADPQGDCILGPDDIRLAGVQIDLYDANGIVVSTTVTDNNGFYIFNGLRPGAYSVFEHQPAGYDQGMTNVGSVGGIVPEDDHITQIPLGSNVDAVNYDFCEELKPPLSKLAGYVFQDGPPVQVLPGQTPDFSGKTGIRGADSIPIAGVRLVLLDMSTGTPVIGTNGLPRTVITDANGYYEFADLTPGLYAVQEFQPGQYIDSIDHAGSTSGFAVNKSSTVESAQAFAVFPFSTIIKTFDVIVQINVPGNAASINNNFSEVLTQTIILPPPPLPPTTPPPPIAPPALPAALLPLNPFIQPAIIARLYIDGTGMPGNTWHLSVIDAGMPRTVRDTDPQFAFASMLNLKTWSGVELDRAKWEFIGRDGKTMQSGNFGNPEAIPVPGDYDGDGIAEMGVYIHGEWFIDINHNGKWDADDLWARLGTDDDLPVVGDWDGDGKDDIGIYGPSWPRDPHAIRREPGLPITLSAPNGKEKNMPPLPEDAALGSRSVKRSLKGKLRADVIDHVFNFGTAGDQPVAGDWTGQGSASIGVFRNGEWHLDVNGNGKFDDGDMVVQFGQPGDRPVVGDWTGDGIDKLGVYRDGKFILDTNGNHRIDPEDTVIEVKDPDLRNGLPFAGDWDGDGRDEVGVMSTNGATGQVQSPQ